MLGTCCCLQTLEFLGILSSQDVEDVRLLLFESSPVCTVLLNKQCNVHNTQMYSQINDLRSIHSSSITLGHLYFSSPLETLVCHHIWRQAYMAFLHRKCWTSSQTTFSWLQYSPQKLCAFSPKRPPSRKAFFRPKPAF